MTNVLSRLNRPQVSPLPSSSADLERAIDAAGDARDIAKDMLRRLPDYDGSEEESTARHDVPQMPAIHVHMHSEPDHDSVTGLPELPKSGPWRWVVLGVTTVVAAVLTWLSGRIGAK